MSTIIPNFEDRNRYPPHGLHGTKKLKLYKRKEIQDNFLAFGLIYWMNFGKGRLG
jgi:hypothetical protein